MWRVMLSGFFSYLHLVQPLFPLFLFWAAEILQQKTETWTPKYEKSLCQYSSAKKDSDVKMGTSELFSQQMD